VHAAELRDEGEALYCSAWRRCAGRRARSATRTYHVVLAYSGDDSTEPSSTAVDVTVAAPTSTVTSAPSTQPSAATNVTASRLNAMAARLAAALRTRGFAALTTTAETLAASVPGLLEQKIYSPSAPKSATTAAARKPVLIASGSVRFTKAGRATLRLRLTSAGRKAIRHAKALKLAIVTRFTPRTGSAVVTTRRLTVTANAKAKRASSARAATASDWGGVQLQSGANPMTVHLALAECDAAPRGRSRRPDRRPAPAASPVER
jgi:hypothetical protein